MKESKTFSLTEKEVALIADITGITIPATGSQDIEVPESVTLPLLQIVKDLKPVLLALKPLLSQVKDLPWDQVKLTQSEPEPEPETEPEPEVEPEGDRLFREQYEAVQAVKAEGDRLFREQYEAVQAVEAAWKKLEEAKGLPKEKIPDCEELSAAIHRRHVEAARAVYEAAGQRADQAASAYKEFILSTL